MPARRFIACRDRDKGRKVAVHATSENGLVRCRREHSHILPGDDLNGASELAS